MSPRAAAMSRDERRKAIVGVLVPLLAEHGEEVSTREIAQAAEIAEGTIFRVFPDKRSLMLAALEEAINPAGGHADFTAALAGVPTLREQLVVVTEQTLARMRLTMSVMLAVRGMLFTPADDTGEPGPDHVHQHGHHHGHAAGDPQGPDGKKGFGPPQFVLDAQAELQRRITGVFEPHRAELGVEPDVAAVVLRSLIFGSSRHELGMVPALTTDQIVDTVLRGVLARPETEPPPARRPTPAASKNRTEGDS